jgi:phosphate butyryltransferase
MNLSGQLKNCIIEGPLALDVALDTGAALMKGLDNPVAGDADCLLFANIDAGNVFYKANTKLAQAEAAAVLMGAKVPVVLASRGDSILTKRYSMALAALISMNESELTKPKKNKNMTSFKCY